jgi:hypothetical protein
VHAISNAFMQQIEVVQKNRWDQGPLEIAFVGASPRISDGEDAFKLQVALHTWNQNYAAGQIRPGDVFDAVTARVPGIEHRTNPNIILAPVTDSGVSELHVMLASLLPDAVLRETGLTRLRANMGLLLTGRYDLPPAFPAEVEQAFAGVMWSKLAPQRRTQPGFFSRSSPLRLLAGDARFWMNRIYRIALDRRENGFTPVVQSNERWDSIDDLKKVFHEKIPPEERACFYLRRPLKGGTIWDENDHGERETVLEEAIHGAGVMESLEPVIELLQSQRAHEDFSSRASWVKEDFERSFYSKRAKLKVELIETLDDAPVWSTDECEGYGEVLFRDLVAALDVRKRQLFLALRMGKTVTEIAASEGLAGHAALSRRVQSLKAKLTQLLQ